MKLPKTLQVGPYTYRVEVVPDLLNEAKESLFGHADHAALVIRIGTTCPPGRLGTTLMHELLHAVAEMAGTELPEEQVRTLAPALTDTLERNGLLAACWSDDAEAERPPLRQRVGVELPEER